MRRTRTMWRLLAAVFAAGLLIPAAQAMPAQAAGGPNLAIGRTASASSVNGQYVAGNLNDGNPATYWESTGALPQWAQVDLGSVTAVDQVVLKLPAGWAARTETVSLQGSNDGTGFATIVASTGYTFDPAGGNTVTVNFPATTTRFVRASVSANTGWTAAQLAELEVHGTAATGGNLAQGKTLTASSAVAPYAAGNAGDGDASSYWESANNAFPQWLQVDLGASVAVDKLVLRVPPSADWGARTETLAVQGSGNGTSFADIVASAGYTFDPATGNTVTVSFTAATTRYLRLYVTGNTGWPAAQVSEFEVYGPATGDTQPPSAPANLAYTQPASGQIRLTWSASTDNVGVTGYDIYAGTTLRTSVAGNVLSYTDTQPDSATVSYFVRAKDAAGNQSADSNTVTRTGTSPDTQAPSAPANLAYTQPASGQIRLTWSASTDNVGVTGYDIYAGNAVRGSVAGTVLSYTDTQPDTATVTYYVRARDAAGNLSANSNSVTRTGSGQPGTNLAAGKPVTASGSVFTFVPANAVDNDVATYWEGAAGFPSTLTVQLGANASITSINVKLNPDSAWGTRTQTIQVLGREQSATAFTGLSPATAYTFNPATSNTVTIPVTATVADVRLVISSNSGAPAGQVAELQVMGTPAANPDLTVTGSSWTPASPVETDAVTASATVHNGGTAASAATNVTFYLGSTLVGTAPVGALAAGASSTVSANIGTRTAGTYQLISKVDEANSVIELNEANNTFTNPGSLVVAPVQSADLVATTAWSPGNPSAGNTVTFAVTVKNQGTIASSSGGHAVTVTVLDASGATVKTLTGTVNGSIAAGATAAPVTVGTWTAVNGRYTVRTVVAADAQELPVKQANNTASQSFFVGRGANLPYDMYEAEDGTVGGGATVVGPNRVIGDPAGEASGRRAVTLNAGGQYVQWTTRASTNTLVVRFSIPDGTTSSLDIYVDGTFHKAINLTSHYAWLYGAEASPTNSPQAGTQRHIYDEANVMLDASVPAGHTIRLQKDAANGGTFAVDFVNLEQVAPVGNPDPSKYLVPAGFTQQDVQNALDTVRQSSTALGVYLPAGTYTTSGKFQVYGKAVKVTGAGPWYTRFQTPTTQDNTDAGFQVDGTANGSSFTNFAFFGDYTDRIGGGKVWGDLKDVSNLTIDNIWVEHQLCMYWGVHNTNITITNSRIRDTFADGINFTNDTTGVHLSNDDARTTGDDSFALFSAIDSGGSVGNHDNVFENLSSTLTWRASGFAVYGGYNNVFRNLYAADTLTYPGLTISSLNFDIPFVGFGTQTTQFSNISLVRDGGHFWGSQAFPALWLHSASKEFRAIRVNDVDIVDPTYSGIMFQTKYDGSTPEFPITDTVFTNVTVTGAQRSGDALDAKSGFGVWANEQPEPGQGPAVGSVTFNNLTFANNVQNVRNTTTTFTITIN